MQSVVGVAMVPEAILEKLEPMDSAAVKRCSSEVYSPAERLGKGSGPKRLVKY